MDLPLQRSIKDKEFEIRELEQQKFLFEEVITFFKENQTTSKEIIDSLSHELRTPVVTIKANIDMLLNGHFGVMTPEQKEKLQKVKKNTDLLIDYIFQILERSKKQGSVS